MHAELSCIARMTVHVITETNDVSRMLIAITLFGDPTRHKQQSHLSHQRQIKMASRWSPLTCLTPAPLLPSGLLILESADNEVETLVRMNVELRCKFYSRNTLLLFFVCMFLTLTDIPLSYTSNPQIMDPENYLYSRHQMIIIHHKYHRGCRVM